MNLNGFPMPRKCTEKNEKNLFQLLVYERGFRKKWYYKMQ